MIRDVLIALMLVFVVACCALAIYHPAEGAGIEMSSICAKPLVIVKDIHGQVLGLVCPMSDNSITVCVVKGQVSVAC